VSVVGFDPATASASDEEIDSFPTETAESGTATADPFSVSVERVEQCGRACRDVTIALTNDEATTARNVTVYTRVYAENGTDGEVLWENRRPVGALGAGDSTTFSERVSLSLSDAATVRNADGQITVQMTVQSDGETMTVTERRDVM